MWRTLFFPATVGFISVSLLGCGGKKPTPAPTPAPLPCSTADWSVVVSLEHNQNYLGCINDWKCFLADQAHLNTTCVKKCLHDVGCSQTCAGCVIDNCKDLSCPKCYGGPTPAPTPPHTPLPTPPPTAYPCTDSEWKIVSGLHTNQEYIKCSEQLGCWDSLISSEDCVRTCLQIVDCGQSCASCVASECVVGHCERCFSGATPAPTATPCTNSEWSIVEGLGTNNDYLQCDEQLGCWDGFGKLNKDCVVVCLQHSGCSSVCAHCVVDSCFEGQCDHCHAAPTPAPTPFTSTPCNKAEWAIVDGLAQNADYWHCEETNNCWEGYGIFNKTCVSDCMQKAGCSLQCADCVVDYCTSLNCPQCHDPVPTPAPTTFSLCSKSEWTEVIGLEQNQAYLSCINTRKCWQEDVHDLNKTCVSHCLQTVAHCSDVCADCVVHFCTSHSGNCPTCYQGPMPTLPPTPPHTPSPTSPTEYACTSSEWNIVNDLHNNAEYIQCSEQLGCWDSLISSEACVRTCLQIVGCSQTCASCVATECVHGHCEKCASGATPSPTATPCTDVEKNMVDSLSTNAKYLQCDEELECWDGLGKVNKQCVDTCLQHAGLSSVCAHCVVADCFSGECNACFAAATPAPTPFASTPCSKADWTIVDGLAQNADYWHCEEKNHCWEGYGSFNKTCVSICMTQVQIPPKCADCVVDYCTSMNCPACHDDMPTPPPTSFSLCSTTEWKEVSTLESNSAYLNCVNTHHCIIHEGGEINKTCVAGCLKTVVSDVCADCVEIFCQTLDCPTCYQGPATPTPAPTAPLPTPAPTDACSQNDWKIIENLHDNADYLTCSENAGCWNSLNENEVECVKNCLTKVEVPEGCATCVASHCLGGHCELCYHGATPAPTATPCSSSEWAQILDLDSNSVYTTCMEDVECWNGFGALDTKCWSTCLELAGCSTACSVCVAENCLKADCAHCHPSPTPAPTPFASPPCTTQDWTVVTGLSKNVAYAHCEETNKCWDGYGVFNKECMSSCMQAAGCSKQCASCVVVFCISMECPACKPPAAHTFEEILA